MLRVRKRVEKKEQICRSSRQQDDTHLPQYNDDSNNNAPNRCQSHEYFYYLTVGSSISVLFRNEVWWGVCIRMTNYQLQSATFCLISMSLLHNVWAINRNHGHATAYSTYQTQHEKWRLFSLNAWKKAAERPPSTRWRSCKSLSLL